MYRIKNKKITVRVPGTCGELAQGIIDDNCFHITCPINLFSCVSVEPSKKMEVPSDKWKSQAAVEKTLKFFEENIPLKVQICSEIPVGCGMASSTADIVGVCFGVAKLLRRKIADDEISKIALSIEPTDGTMFRGITLFDHREGEMKEGFGSPPKMKILVVDLGVRVDTIQFNKNDFSKEHHINQKKIEHSVKLIKTGIKQNDIHLIGKGATISALCNQKILYKPELEKILDIALKMGAVGINVAHSGGVVGILLNYNFSNIELLKNKIHGKLTHLCKFYETELIDGGAKIEKLSRWEYKGSN